MVKFFNTSFLVGMLTTTANTPNCFPFEPADRTQTPNSRNPGSARGRARNPRSQTSLGSSTTRSTTRGRQWSKTITTTTKITTKTMLEAMGAGEGRVPGDDGCCRAEAGERGEHRRHRNLAGRPQRFYASRSNSADPGNQKRAGKGEGDGERVLRGYHAPRMDRITAPLRSDQFGSEKTTTKAKDLGTGSERGRGGEARCGCGLALGVTIGRLGVGLILFLAP
jgi:hypothetical protein